MNIMLNVAMLVFPEPFKTKNDETPMSAAVPKQIS